MAFLTIKDPDVFAHDIAHARSTLQWRSAEDVARLGVGGSDMTDAYNVQRELASGKFAEQIGPLVGWKCGATNADAQFALQVDGPFLGPLFANSVVHLGSGVQWSVEYKTLGAPSFKPNSEAEFAFVMKDSLPPREKGDLYTENQVWEAVMEVCPAIEIVGSRYDAPGSETTTSAKVADCAINAVAIMGPGVARKSIGDWSNLAEVHCSLIIDGSQAASGAGSNVLGNPVTSLTWLANDLPRRTGHHLRKGDVVMSGAVCNANNLNVGSTISVSFLGLPTGGETGTSVILA